MVADAILDCSARGDVVLDPFLGKRHHIDRRGTRRSLLLWDGDRSALRRHHHSALAGLYRRHGAHAVTGKRFDDLASEMEARHG